MRIILFFFLLSLGACNAQKWEGGQISEAGVYEYNGLKIILTDKDNSLDYLMLDSKGDTLVRSDRKFSSFQRWAIQLDKDQNLWILSSDIGDACWKKDIQSKKYFKKEFFGLITKDSIPSEIWSTLKQFHPYSSQK